MNNSSAGTYGKDLKHQSPGRNHLGLLERGPRKEEESTKQVKVNRQGALSPTVSSTKKNTSYRTFGQSVDSLNETHKDLSDQDFNLPYPDTATSTHALQVTLKNMKERYKILQKKISILEEENGRLIHGKSELFGEIGKMQENSIKLREKNLQLNQEVHSQHTECCSLKDKFTSLNGEKVELQTELFLLKLEKKRIEKQYDSLSRENDMLREGLLQAVDHCKSIPGIPSEPLNEWEILARSTKRLNLDVSESPHSDKDYALDKDGATLKSPKTKIIPTEDDLHSFDDIEPISAHMDSVPSLEDHTSNSSTNSSSIEQVTEDMVKIVNLLTKQKEDLVDLQPLILSCKLKGLDSSAIHSNAEDHHNRFTTGRLATYGSVAHNNCSLSSEIGQLLTASKENTSLEKELVERKSPFDWRELQLDNGRGHSPEMRDRSTSPDITLSYKYDSVQCVPKRLSSSVDDDDDRKCPMCYTNFPLNVPMETFIQHVAGHFEQETGFQITN